MIKHKKKFGIYHWDTFDNSTILIDEADTYKICEEKVKKRYKSRINNKGADTVEIVNLKGDVLKSFSVC